MCQKQCSKNKCKKVLTDKNDDKEKRTGEKETGIRG